MARQIIVGTSTGQQTADWFNSGIGLKKANLTATTDPTSGDDSAADYEAGSLWVNVTDNKIFICVDSSAGAAVWLDTASADLADYFNKATDTSDDIVEGVVKLFLTVAERAKLVNVPNDTNAELLTKFDKASDTSDDITEGIVNLFLTVLERDKLVNVPNDTNTELSLKFDKAGGAVSGDVNMDGNNFITTLLNGIAIANYVLIGGDIGGTGAAPVINNGAVTNAKLADIATQRIKGRTTAGTGDVEDLTAADVKTMLDLPTDTVNALADKLPLAGGTMTGDVDMDSNDITNGGTIQGKVIVGATISAESTNFSALTNSSFQLIDAEANGVIILLDPTAAVGTFASFQVESIVNRIQIETDVGVEAYASGIGLINGGVRIDATAVGDAFTITVVAENTYSIVGGTFS